MKLITRFDLASKSEDELRGLPLTDVWVRNHQDEKGQWQARTTMRKIWKKAFLG